MTKRPHTSFSKPIINTVARLSIEVKVDALLVEAGTALSPKEALEKSLRARDLAESIGYEAGVVNSLQRAAACYGQLGDYETALSAAFEARDFLRHYKDKKAEAAVAQTTGTVYWNLGDYETALRFALQSIELALDIGETILAAQGYTTAGNIYFRLRDYPQSLASFEKGLAIATQSNHPYGESLLLNNIANVYEQLRRYDEAIEALHQSLVIKEALNDVWGQGHSLVSIGNCYSKLGKLKKAEAYYRKSLRVRREIDDKGGMIISLLSLGRSRRDDGDSARALSLFLEALDLTRDIKQSERIAEIHCELSKTYEDTGDFKLALKHLRAYQEAHEAMLNEEVMTKTKKLQIVHQVAQTSKEMEIYRLSAEQLEQELAHKKRELVSMAMNLVQKNELVDKLKADLQGISKSMSGSCERKMNQVLTSLDHSRRDEKSWQLFEQQFESVHQTFMQTLTHRFSELTKTELRLCVLLKIQLSTKEIAQLLFISPRSVETYRLRLRRKLGLSAETNLTEFLLSL